MVLTRVTLCTDPGPKLDTAPSSYGISSDCSVSRRQQRAGHASRDVVQTTLFLRVKSKCPAWTT